METDDLIDRLALDATPTAPHVGERRLLQTGLLGVGASLAVLLAFYGLRPDLSAVALTGPFAVKVGVPLVVAVLGATALLRLGHPGLRTGLTGWLAIAPVLLLWVWGAWVWAHADAAQRLPLLLGSTWQSCVISIAVLAAPVALAGWWTLRGLAPTRPALAGAAAGWMAGGAGAAVYALHCPEMAAPFLAVWYVLGMAVPAAVGAWVGQRWLRW